MIRGVREKSALIGTGIKALIGVILIAFLFSSGCSNDFPIAQDEAEVTSTTAREFNRLFIRTLIHCIPGRH